MDIRGYFEDISIGTKYVRDVFYFIKIARSVIIYRHLLVLFC